MIADLKKENFDLKLRLFHLEDAQREVWEKGGQMIEYGLVRRGISLEG